jgi:hypothetical protein
MLGPTAATLMSAGFLVVWLPLDVHGYRLVLARGWHALQETSSLSRKRSPAVLYDQLGRTVMTEPFSSWLCRVDLQGVDGLGELPGAPGAAAGLAENPPVLELGVRSFAGCTELRVSAVGLFL